MTATRILVHSSHRFYFDTQLYPTKEKKNRLFLFRVVKDNKIPLWFRYLRGTGGFYLKVQ